MPSGRHTNSNEQGLSLLQATTSNAESFQRSTSNQNSWSQVSDATVDPKSTTTDAELLVPETNY